MADPVKAEIYKNKRHCRWLEMKNEDRSIAKQLNAEAARNYRKRQKDLRKSSIIKSDEHSIKLAVRKRHNVRRNKIIINSFKSNGCIICHESEICCLDAHHVNPKDKIFNVGSMVGNTYSLKVIIKELLKCVCLCKNCHAKVHDLKIKLPIDCLKQTNRWQSGLRAMGLEEICI